MVNDSAVSTDVLLCMYILWMFCVCYLGFTAAILLFPNPIIFSDQHHMQT